MHNKATPPETPSAWHNAAPATVLEQLNASEQGLSSPSAQQRLTEHGPNRLPVASRPSALRRFFVQLHNILIYVLLASALITFLLDHLIDTVVIVAVVLINGLIGFIQEGKAEKAMEAIRDMLAPVAAVLRDGQRQSIPGENLVPGDVVLLEAGDKVPADLRLLDTHGLQIQEAILTGESVPVDKTADAVEPSASLGDRSCMAFSGTLVTAGQGRGVVVATGPEAEIGRISGLLTDVTTLTTPLVSQMNTFSRWLTAVILILAVILLGFGFLSERYAFEDMFMAVVGLSVAAIPEGLPAVLTITLAIGVQAMARRNAIVRRLPAIETLGSVSVICTDKTGTLTRNEMNVRSVLTAGRDSSVDGEGYAPSGSVLPGAGSEAAGEDQALRRLALATALCNDASLIQQEAHWEVEGDPMEGALLAFAFRSGLEQSYLDEWQRMDVLPFDSRHRFMATRHRHPEEGEIIWLKGAPEKLLAMADHQLQADGSLAALEADAWRQRAEALAADGQRVLAIALQRQSMEGSLQEDNLTEVVLLGLTGMMDPPRPEAVEAIAECHQAGIRVKMITGDHAGTARAIARQIGLENPEQVLTGEALDNLDDAMLADAVLKTDIFARTSPEHKLRLVMALQAQNRTVAMTGDGVNDAPALKRADAGIAMGRKGSEAAREASELVLADDNFASIVSAVREGRTVYDNIKKVITWTLPTNAGEASTIIIALLFGMTLPITPVQILWINLVTAVSLGIALAFEPTEARTMQRPPRPRNEALLNGALVWQIVLTSILFTMGVFGIYFHSLNSGHSMELARTMALNTLVVMEIFYLFFIRNLYETSLTWQAVKGTPVVWMTVAGVTLAQLILTYVPFMQGIFNTHSISPQNGILVIGTGVLLFAITEIEKQIRLRLFYSNTTTAS